MFFIHSSSDNLLRNIYNSYKLISQIYTSQRKQAEDTTNHKINLIGWLNDNDSLNTFVVTIFQALYIGSF